MEEYSKDAWEEIVGRCEEVGVDGFEINFSCPHGMPGACPHQALHPMELRRRVAYGSMAVERT